MIESNVKEMLDGVDEEQLAMIVSALEETATRYDHQGHGHGGRKNANHSR